MADNNVRSYRSRDPASRDPLVHGAADLAPADVANDPLAELARLIGQSGPGGDLRYNSRQSQSDDRAAYDNAAAGDLNWTADDRYEDERQRADDRYATPPLADPYPPEPSYQPQNGAYRDELPAPLFNGTTHDSARDYAAARGVRYLGEQEPAPASNGHQLPSFIAEPRGDRFEPDDQPHTGSELQPYAVAEVEPHAEDEYADEQAYAADAYYDESPAPRRRSGAVIIVAVLGLVVLGSAGAFGYRAMFGDSALPSLPPIIKPADGPTKIKPSHDVQADASNSTGAGIAGAGAKLVSHEEQPVDIPQPVQNTPRVVSTIPVFPDPNAGSAAAMSGGAPGAGGYPASPFPPADVPTRPMMPGTGSPPQAAMPAAPPSPAVPTPSPKKVHTVSIRPDQAGAAPRALAQRPAGNAPLALVPSAQTDAPVPAPPRTRAASTRPTALTEPVATASTGGYAMQVTSQHSEAEAQSAYRALRAKYPGQLGSRQPVFRSVDLGAKGTFYRALVPFASAEEAGSVCNSLKAAGGSCIVQRN